MRKRYFLSALMSLSITACNGEGLTDGEGLDFTTCLGFMSPQLSVNVTDSLTGLPVADAVVTLYITAEDGSQSSFTMNADSNSEHYYVEGISLESGRYSVVASQDNYHSAVIRDQVFTVDTACGAYNDWTIEVAMCPLGSACL